MKPISFFFLTVFCLTTLCFFNNATFAQVGSPEYVVRVIYFLPSDRTPQPDINEKLDKLIKDTQLFYAEQMTAHGFGTKTFEFEADTAGKVVVHRLSGQFNTAYYNNDNWREAWQEVTERFDPSNNIWLILFSGIRSLACGRGTGSSHEGVALIFDYGCLPVTAHELGHAFGLMHDNRTPGNGKWIPSAYNSDPMITSFCSAEWLDVHRYFEINPTLSTEMLAPNPTSLSPSAPLEMTHLCGVGAFDDHEYFKVNQTVPGDAPPTFEMLGPPSLAAAPNAIRLRFRVTDADGIHQVQLHTPEWNYFVAGGFIACKRVSGTTATVEFVTTELSPRSESVWLQMIDVRGNFRWSDPYPINVTTVLPPATVVSIPDAQLAAAIREQIGNITTHSLLNLRKIDEYSLNRTGIKDLTGLEYAYNLKILRARDGEITDLHPLANLTSLINLGLTKHQIRDTRPLQNLTNLISLAVSENDLSNITALQNLTKLTVLFLHTNRIHDITALQNLTKLTELHLGINQISDITALRNLTNLRRLYLRWNQITDVSPLVGLVNLEELYLAGNPIEDLSPLQTLRANNPNLKIDIDVPLPPPTDLTFNPNTIADQAFTVGEAVTLTLPVATGGTPPYTYTLTPLPEGLSFDATERVLSGKPTTVETISATYTATDAANMSASLTFTIEVTEGVILDVNEDGQVNVIDLAIVALFYGTQVPADTSLPADVNADGIVNILDLTAVAQAIDAASGGNGLSLQAVEAALLAAAEQAAGIEAIAEAPMGFGDQHQHPLSSRITHDNVADALADVRHLATGDVRLGKGVTVLEELLHLLSERVATPEQTALLPNYPNPFNPETWIPYHLATDAKATLTIYDVRGSVVRTLTLGHQSAGVYESRGRAAYWDGKNRHGEPVASGVYFYTLSTESTRDSVTAGDFTATRKLLIVK